jgi:ABC-type dipeptide/oligopeptide/nickel transport system permease component
LKRLGQTLIVLFFVSLFAFIVVRLAPGDPARMMVSENATVEQIEAVREALGLNKPLPTQYFIYISGVIRGDLGTSVQYKRPVLDVIKGRLPVTFRLASSTLILILIISLPLGVIAGTHQGSLIDFGAMFFAMLGQSMTPVWLGVLLIYVFSVKLGWLPSLGSETGVTSIIMPAIALGLQSMAETTRITRSEMIDIMKEDYITSIYAKGLSRQEVRWKYAFKNALPPVVTLSGISLGSMLAGTIVVETIFVWSGIGQMLFQAVSTRDYPLVQSTLLVSAVLIAVINLIVDIINSFIDPRITLE